MSINKETFKRQISLLQEGRYLFERIFRSAPSDSILADYQKAVEHLLGKEDKGVGLLVQRKIDIEAVELAWRRINPGNSLTRRIHILMYLTETTPENFHRFYLLKSGKINAWIFPVFHLLRTIYKLIKGKVLIKRYRLV